MKMLIRMAAINVYVHDKFTYHLFLINCLANKMFK